VIYVAAARGTTPAALVRQIRPLLLREFVVRAAQAQVDTDVQRLSGALGLLTAGLLAFGFIAVFVGALVIFNTFSVTITQRVQEFAAIGFDLPSTGLVFAPRTAVLGLVVGVLVTVIAGLLPALRATRVAPLEALRTSRRPAASGTLERAITAGLASVLAIGGLVLILTNSGTAASRLAASAPARWPCCWRS
jgi:putative ABC transport system permease protein